MAIPSPPISFFLLFLVLSFSSTISYASHGEDHLHHLNTHTIHVSSLLPSAVCASSVNQGNNKVGSLKVVHKHGPCSQLSNQQKGTAPSHAELLLRDQSRVDSIHTRLSTKADLSQTESANIPAKSGSTIGSGNYIVTVGLGTPKKDLSLIFDTGSDLTWTQCEPCVGSCYQQKEPTFDPSDSKSYSNISCSAPLCSDLTSATGNSPQCSGATCVYGIQYGDKSFSVGFFGKETLSLTPRDVFSGFYFGCGQNNQGLFGGAAGLLGLGRDKISVVQQTAAKYGRFFSYCLPSTASGTGHLTFGKGGGISNTAKFTPLSSVSASSSFYGLDFTGISVGGKDLSISPSVFKTSGAIIDSGTVITRLPPAAYSAVRTAFRQLMSKYPMAPALSILDTCYDFSKYNTVIIPKIAFSFSGGVKVDIDSRGIMYAASVSQVCLGFAGNSDASDVAIYGNTQQLRLEVVYDAAGGRVGFAPGGCA